MSHGDNAVKEGVRSINRFTAISWNKGHLVQWFHGFEFEMQFGSNFPFSFSMMQRFLTREFHLQLDKKRGGGVGPGWKWRNKTIWGGGGRKNIPGTNWILTLTSTRERESSTSSGFVLRLWDWIWMVETELVAPFLMCNDGFMPACHH